MRKHVDGVDAMNPTAPPEKTNGDTTDETMAINTATEEALENNLRLRRVSYERLSRQASCMREERLLNPAKEFDRAGAIPVIDAMIKKSDEIRELSDSWYEHCQCRREEEAKKRDYKKGWIEAGITRIRRCLNGWLLWFFTKRNQKE